MSNVKSRGAAPGPRTVLRGHSDIVTALHFLPCATAGAEAEGGDTQQLLLSASCDGDIMLWDIGIQRHVLVLSGAHSGSVLSLSSLRHGNKSCVLSSSRDGTVKVWDLNRVSSGECNNDGYLGFNTTDNGNNNDNNKPLVTLQTDARHFCNSATFSSPAVAQQAAHTIATPSQEEGEVLLFDMCSAEKTATIRGPPTRGMVSAIALSRLGAESSSTSTSSGSNSGSGGGACEVVLAGYEDGSLYLYDLRSPQRELLSTGPLHGSQLMSIDVSPAGTSVITSGADTVVSRIKLDVGVSGNEATPAAAAGGGGYVSIALAKTVKSKSAGEEPSSNKTNGISCVRYRGDGKIIVAGGWDGSVRLFDSKALRPLAVLMHHKDSVYAAEFGGSLFASGGKDRTIAVWDVYAESYRK